MAAKDTVHQIPGYKRRMQKDVAYTYDPSKPKCILQFTEVGRRGGESVKEFWILTLDTPNGSKVVELEPRDIETLRQTIKAVEEILTATGVAVPSTWVLRVEEDGDHLKFKVGVS